MLTKMEEYIFHIVKWLEIRVYLHIREIYHKIYFVKNQGFLIKKLKKSVDSCYFSWDTVFTAKKNLDKSKYIKPNKKKEGKLKWQH